MIMKRNYGLFLLLGLFLGMGSFQNAQAQGSETYGKGIRININEDGSKYIRFITWHQMWLRYIDNNPGTQVNAEDQAGTWDIGVRRSRFLWYTQISPRYLILMHVGINNQTFINGGASGSAGTGGYGVGKKPQVFIHDLWNEYMVVKDNKLSVGFGLHYWNGVSRLASASTLNFLALDAPIHNWALIEESDQFARQFGIYLKGKLGRFDYRVALNKPFATPFNSAATTPSITLPNRAISGPNNSWAAAGYFTYDFFDKESNVLPFFVGTYVGTKKVFNIGAGFHYHPHATTSFNSTSNQLEKHNMLLLGVDSFLDMPVGTSGSAVTAYVSYLNYNFGPNYIRSIGIMNEGVPAPTGALPQGGGNAQYMIGTGTIFYGEAGYLLPKNTLGKSGKLQFFVTGAYKNFEALDEPHFQYGAGLNWFIDGHHAKISLKYQTRGLYGTDPDGAAGPQKAKLNTDRSQAGELILQTQIYL